MITDIVETVSAQSGMSLQDSMDFVYNSESLERAVSEPIEAADVENIKLSMLNELHHAAKMDELNHAAIVAEDIPQYGK